MRLIHQLITSVGVSLFVLGCGVDPAKITAHQIYADDRETRQTDGAVTFAAVGNTRGPVPALDRAVGGHFHGPEVTSTILGDIAANSGPNGASFLVHLGDAVRVSTVSEWTHTAEQLDGIVLRAAQGDGAGAGVPVVPVAGDREAANDGRYRGFGGAWASVGAEIGYNRVASWSAFDVNTRGHVWRLIVLDSGKERLGSRWSEQRNWLKQTLKGEFDGVLVLMHDGLFDLGTRSDAMNRGGGPAELVDLIEAETEMLKLRAVISAGTHSSQALLPDGPFGTAHITAGGGGAPAVALRRWGPADSTGRAEDVQLEPMFDLAVMAEVDRRARTVELPAVVLDEARAKGSFEGFTGAYHPEHFPTYGWWQVTLFGDTVDLIFRMLSNDELRDAYRLNFTPKNGWKSSQLGR